MKLHVQVKLGKKNEKIQRTNNSWLISINAPATEGKANERLIEFFSEVYSCNRKRIKELLCSFESGFRNKA